MLKLLIVVFSLGLIWSIAFMLNRQSKVLVMHDVDFSKEPLKKFEIYNIWCICLLSPMLGGAILYYGWKKNMPIKAKDANKISILAFIADLFIFFLYGLFYPV
jgi:hypothetical protein